VTTHFDTTAQAAFCIAERGTAACDAQTNRTLARTRAVSDRLEYLAMRDFLALGCQGSTPNTERAVRRKFFGGK